MDALEPLREPALNWLRRPLSDCRCWALYIDGTNFRVQRRGSTELEPSLVVVGVDETNHRGNSPATLNAGTMRSIRQMPAISTTRLGLMIGTTAFRITPQRGYDGGRPLPYHFEATAMRRTGCRADDIDAAADGQAAGRSSTTGRRVSAA